MTQPEREPNSPHHESEPAVIDQLALVQQPVAIGPEGILEGPGSRNADETRSLEPLLPGCPGSLGGLWRDQQSFKSSHKMVSLWWQSVFNSMTSTPHMQPQELSKAPPNPSSCLHCLKQRTAFVHYAYRLRQ